MKLAYTTYRKLNEIFCNGFGLLQGECGKYLRADVTHPHKVSFAISENLKTAHNHMKTPIFIRTRNEQTR
jgi:hypothetical protein